MATPQVIPQGWYPDPVSRHASRYWDGTQWTATVSDGAGPVADPLEVPAGPAPIWPTPSPGPATAPGARRGRPWAIVAIVAVVVLGAVAGLVIWAPWTSPPVLRPAALVAGQPTTSSVAFRWSGPPSGPLPDRYLIVQSGKVIGSVRGTITTYQQAGLAPATAYQYRVVAVRGGVRSPASKVLTMSTATPPVSAARVQGQWTVFVKIVKGGATLTGKGPKQWTESWTAVPACVSGPCKFRLTAELNRHSFKAALTRHGAVYTGKTTANVFPCGHGANSFPIHSALTIRLKITSANVNSRVWTASSWTGTLTVVSPYTASGLFYCAAANRTASVSGTF